MPPPAIRIAVGHAMRETASSEVAQPPLAGLEAAIARFGKQIGQCRARVGQGDHSFDLGAILGVRVAHAFRPRRLVPGDAVLVRVLPGDDRGE